MLMRAATVVHVQVLHDFFKKFYCMFYFTCDRSLTIRSDEHKGSTQLFYRLSSLRASANNAELIAIDGNVLLRPSNEQI